MTAPPAVWPRVVAAAMAGAVASAAAVALALLLVVGFESPGLGLLFGAIAFATAAPVALAHALLIALPLYALLHRRLRLTRASAALAGFAIGAVPIALGLYSPTGAPPAAGDPAQRLAAGLAFGVLGAIGGLTFESVFRRLGPPAVEA